jgi:hypothetical protein
MSESSDRVLMAVLVVTALGALVMWIGGFVGSETGRVREVLFSGILLLIALAAVILAWRSTQRMEQ